MEICGRAAPEEREHKPKRRAAACLCFGASPRPCGSQRLCGTFTLARSRRSTQTKSRERQRELSERDKGEILDSRANKISFAHTWCERPRREPIRGNGPQSHRKPGFSESRLRKRSPRAPNRFTGPGKPAAKGLRSPGKPAARCGAFPGPPPAVSRLGRKRSFPAGGWRVSSWLKAGRPWRGYNRP